MERQIAERIVDAAYWVNRELVFARERLRAARVASPPDLTTFVRAVLARGTGRNASNGQINAEDVFHGIYTPASSVKRYESDAVDRSEVDVRQGDEAHGRGRTWRNAVFDITSAPLG